MVLRLMPCSPRRRIRLVTVACRLRSGRTRLGLENLCKLGTSNGCRDHTVLPYARYVVRPARRGIAHELGSPCDRDRADALASTASRPAFVTTRDPPLLSERDSAERAIDLSRGKAKYFYAKGWPTEIILKGLSKSYSARNGYSAPRPHEHARMQAVLPDGLNQRSPRHYISTSAAHKSQS